MEQDLIQLAEKLGPWGSGVIALFLLHRAGLLSAVIVKIFGSEHKGTSEEIKYRVERLEAFRQITEGNHFHDIDDLKRDVRALGDKFASIDGRVIRLETKISEHGKSYKG